MPRITIKNLAPIVNFDWEAACRVAQWLQTNRGELLSRPSTHLPCLKNLTTIEHTGHISDTQMTTAYTTSITKIVRSPQIFPSLRTSHSSPAHGKACVYWRGTPILSRAVPSSQPSNYFQQRILHPIVASALLTGTAPKCAGRMMLSLIAFKALRRCNGSSMPACTNRWTKYVTYLCCALGRQHDRLQKFVAI